MVVTNLFRTVVDGNSKLALLDLTEVILLTRYISLGTAPLYRKNDKISEYVDVFWYKKGYYVVQ